MLTLHSCSQILIPVYNWVLIGTIFILISFPNPLANNPKEIKDETKNDLTSN